MKMNVMLTPLVASLVALVGGLMGQVLVLKSRRWRDGERGLRAANDLQWRRQA